MGHAKTTANRGEPITSHCSILGGFLRSLHFAFFAGLSCSVPNYIGLTSDTLGRRLSSSAVYKDRPNDSTYPRLPENTSSDLAFGALKSTPRGRSKGFGAVGHSQKHKPDLIRQTPFPALNARKLVLCLHFYHQCWRWPLSKNP